MHITYDPTILFLEFYTKEIIMNKCKFFFSGIFMPSWFIIEETNFDTFIRRNIIRVIEKYIIKNNVLEQNK